MYSFSISLYALIHRPITSVKDRLESNDPDFLTFTSILILMIASSQYIGFLYAFNIGSSLSTFTYIILMAFYAGYFFLVTFVESAITGHFLKHRNVTPFHFGSKQVFFLVSLSYFPYLFFPAASLVSNGLSQGIYCLFMISLFVWMIILRKNLFQEYNQYFTVSPWTLVLLPLAIHFAIAFLVLFFLGSSVVIMVVQGLQDLIEQALRSGGL
ncbi:MAG: hypothetical protein IEMM0008_0997 [bacterium]|nr:MAG: hypothetical protein IEMM0008_0997 [bacterium]